MQINRFRGKGIHGYLNFDVKFNNDLTFLTGINGSGKTSIIQAIIALISPSLFVLSNLEYEDVRVFIEHQGKSLEIFAKREEDSVLLGTSITKEPLVIQRLIPDPDDMRIAEKETEYYRTVGATHSAHPVMAAINELPTPMFLDLDRRARSSPEMVRSLRYSRQVSSRRPRNIFSFSLAHSLDSATALAENAYRASLLAIAREGEELRKNMILDLLELEPTTNYGMPLALPTRAELQTLKRMRQELTALPQIMQIQRVDVEARLVPTLNTLESFASTIPQGTDIDNLFTTQKPDDPQMRAVLGWSANQPQFKKLVKMVDKVRDYNRRRESHIEQTNKYLKIANIFLKDSGKSLLFDDDGFLNFRIEGMSSVRPTSSLSSGEGQLFVIITHLFFNPQAQQANVFIIDEPELSLHVQWQELFVESVMSANPTVQYIMATHSPSIILDKVKFARDLSRSNRSVSRD